MRLIPPYTREEIPGDCHVIPMPDTWVSDALQGELARWCPTQPVLIAAPTGRGKTEFVKCLAQYQRYRRGSILLLVHRSAKDAFLQCYRKAAPGRSTELPVEWCGRS